MFIARRLALAIRRHARFTRIVVVVVVVVVVVGGQAVLTKKTSGNGEFKAGSFDDAVVTYNDALKDLKVLQDDGDGHLSSPFFRFA